MTSGPIPVVLLLVPLLAGCAPLGPTSTDPLYREAVDHPEIDVFRVSLPRAANGEEDGYRERCGLRRPNKLRGHGASPFLLPHAGSQTGWTAALAGASCSTVNPFTRA